VSSVRSTVLLALAALGVAGCEGYSCSEGVVSDAVTGEPLDGVVCSAEDGDVAVTGADGRHAVCGRFGGCMPECPDVVVEFTKSGYTPLRLREPADVALSPE
jgi:hypothetical protein